MPKTQTRNTKTQLISDSEKDARAMRLAVTKSRTKRLRPRFVEKMKMKDNHAKTERAVKRAREIVKDHNVPEQYQ